MRFIFCYRADTVVMGVKRLRGLDTPASRSQAFLSWLPCLTFAFWTRGRKAGRAGRNLGVPSDAEMRLRQAVNGSPQAENASQRL